VKILYVEDNEDNIFVLESRLKRHGHTVVIARDGASGVQLAASERPDVILMDLSLPVLDGWGGDPPSSRLHSTHGTYRSSP